MVLQMEQTRCQTLTKKIIALECGRLDETALLYPETELWATIVEALCSRYSQKISDMALAKCMASEIGPSDKSMHVSTQ